MNDKENEGSEALRELAITAGLSEEPERDSAVEFTDSSITDGGNAGHSGAGATKTLTPKPRRDILALLTFIATIATLWVAYLTYRDAGELKDRAETPHLTLAIHADVSSGLLVANLTNASTADARGVRVVCARVRPWSSRQGTPAMRHSFPSDILEGQTSPLNIDRNCPNADALIESVPAGADTNRWIMLFYACYSDDEQRRYGIARIMDYTPSAVGALPLADSPFGAELVKEASSDCGVSPS